MKLTVLVIAINAITVDKQDISNSNRSFGFETPGFSKASEERRKPQIDDIYYNVNELQRLKNQGVDVSNFMVAHGMTSGKKRYGKKSRLI